MRCSKNVTVKEEKGRQCCSGSIPDSTNAKARKSSTKCFRGRGGNGGGQGKFVRGRGGNGGGDNFFVLEKEGNTAALSGEIIVESVRSPEEEVKLNTPIPATYIVTISSLYPPFFPQVSNPAAEDSKEMCQGKER